MWREQGGGHSNSQHAWILFGTVRFMCCNDGDASSYSPSSPSSLSSSHRRACGGKQLIVMAMMQLHGFRRLYECFRVHRFSRNSRQHVIVTAGGICFYLLATLAPVVDPPGGGGSFGCCYCSSDSSGSSSAVHDHSIRTTSIKGWTASLGVALFLLASYHQHRCHRILADIRWRNKSTSKQQYSKRSRRRRADSSVGHGDRNSARSADDNGSHYSVPYGDWFRHVSSPHYLAEILIYAAFVIVSETATQILCFVWVASNLCITAHKTHRWYLSHFSSYAQLKRKAIIPLLF